MSCCPRLLADELRYILSTSSVHCLQQEQMALQSHLFCTSDNNVTIASGFELDVRSACCSSTDMVLAIRVPFPNRKCRVAYHKELH
jgi:hypothetical protein